MKYLAISLFLIIPLFGMSQDREIDKETLRKVVQTCFDLPKLQPYLQFQTIDGREVFIINDDGSVPNNLELYVKDKKVTFMEPKELFFYTLNGLQFKEITINREVARIWFRLPSEVAGESIHATIQLKNDPYSSWEVTAHQIFHVN